jgi:hypothetical protein
LEVARVNDGRISCCPNCGTPLIFTFAFSYAEYYCLRCGGKFGMFDVGAKDATPELAARLEELQAEWDEHASGKLLSGGVMLRACETCTTTGKPHLGHATAEEKAEHETATAWLATRVEDET